MICIKEYMMKKIQLHLASEPGIYLQVFLFNLVIFALQYIGANISGSVSAHADALHILTDQIVFFIMISVGVLVLNFREHESPIRVVGGVLGAGLFFFVGSEVILHTLAELSSGEHSVLGPYMLIFTTLALALNWLQHTLLVTAESSSSLTSFDLQGHVQIDMFKNAALIVIALVNSVSDVPYMDIGLGLLIGAWLIWRGCLVLARTYKLFKKTTPAT
jgi:Co/Zn/Cd efflux system component